MFDKTANSSMKRNFRMFKSSEKKLDSMPDLTPDMLLI